jgi:GDP-L-fucose synthase
VTKIFVAGHNGMVGSAICRQLKNQDVEIITASRQELDLTNQAKVREFFNFYMFDQVYLAAAKVGGIHANNQFPTNFIYENLMIEANIMNSAHCTGVHKLLFLGSSCIYPKYANQPISEDELLTGSLEPTNEPYAVAKIAGIKMCESYNRQFSSDYRSVMPTNLYGPGDNFHLENSHVIPALMRRLHEAKINEAPVVSIWGTGNAKREFLHVDDMAEACIYVMNLERDKYTAHTEAMLSHINVGSGIDCTILELTRSIAAVVGYDGSFVFDSSKPDGAPRKLLNVSKLNDMGWSSSISLIEGLRSTYDWFLKNNGSKRT